MHEKILPAASRKFLARLETLVAPALQGWILAGGTGLALQLGHRRSVDFDFFRTAGMSTPDLHAALLSLGAYETLQDEVHTLTVIHTGVKLSFFQVADAFLFDTTPYRFAGLADMRDIALMKLAAVSNRGSRRDFVDLFFLFHGHTSLRESLALMPKKYGKSRVNTYHILKSLTYFADAEAEPMPRMLVPFRWPECKAFFVREAHALTLR